MESELELGLFEELKSKSELKLVNSDKYGVGVNQIGSFFDPEYDFMTVNFINAKVEVGVA